MWAALCNAVLDWSTSPYRTDPWYVEHVAQSLVSTVLLWLVIMILVCVTNRLWFSFAVSLATCILISAASTAKYELRDEPLYPSDLYFLWQPRFLFEMTSPGSLVVTALVLLAVCVVLVMVGRWLDRHFPRVRRGKEPLAWTRLLGARVVVAVVSATILFQALQFNEPRNGIRSSYEAVGASWLEWRQADNYFENGFVAGFLFNTFPEAMERPAGYSRTTMAEIARRYTQRAEDLNVGRSSDALDDLNVVLLLSETFSDPNRFPGVAMAEDPIPFVRSTMADRPSGQTIAHGIGGGTANMEFEALTGMSQALFAPQMTTPFQMLVSAYDQFPSAARYFASRGHGTVAVHPYMGSMYRRNDAYPKLGFDSFLDWTRLAGLSTIGSQAYASDASTYEEVLRLLGSSDEPLFMNVVTMQNHLPYAGRYRNPIRNNLGNEELGQYARGLAFSDTATEQLLAELRDSRDKTLVIFYGDHLPGGVYDAAAHDAIPEVYSRTPFFFWSNAWDLPATKYPDTSPIYFLPLALRAVNAPLPPYYALLTDLHEQVPDLSIAKKDRLTDLSPRAQALLRDFRLVQYDFSVGKRYALEEMFGSAPSS